MQAGPPGVLLVGHGSARSGASAEPVLALGEALRARGFPEVRTAFWKEEPFLHQALDTVRSSAVAVVPIFLAEGYFSRTVVPRELGLRYGANDLGGRTVTLLPPLAAHPELADLVADRAVDAAAAGGGAPGGDLSDALLVVLGHGTPRDPGSADAVLSVCARLSGRAAFGRVAPAFIDQEPRVEQVVASAREPRVVVVPFLVAAGWHGGTTVPRDLELGTSTRVLYAEPVGAHPRLAELVAAWIEEAEPAGGGALRVDTPLTVAARALLERIAAAGEARLLQALVRPTGTRGYELRHVADADTPAPSLRELADGRALERHARRTASGAHRPLRTAADLAPGWRLRAPDGRALTEALVALYGPALTHWHLGEKGAVRGSSFRAAAAPQSGMYARLAQVEPAAVEAGVARVCDGCPCLRTRLWDVDGPRAAPPNEQGAGENLTVPCPAPCPILLTAVLELSGEPGTPAAPGDA